MSLPNEVTKPKPDRIAIGLVFLSGILLGLGIMLIIMTVISKPRLVYTIRDIPGDGETIQARTHTIGAP